jgi:hypothetical protein
MSARIRLGGLVAVALAGAAALALALSTSSPASGAGTDAGMRAHVLAASPDVNRAGPSYDGASTARAQADRAVSRIPLPDGGNVNGIEWERAGGVFTAAEIESVVEYNAFCQWLRAARDDRDRAAALEVLGDVPDWPGFRAQPDLGPVRQIVAEAKAGGGEALSGALADCDRSAQQERAYAGSRRLAPTD